MFKKYRLAHVAPLCLAIFVASLLAAGQSQVLCLRSDGKVVVGRADAQNKCIPAETHNDNCDPESKAPPCGDGGNCIDLAQTNPECDRPKSTQSIDCLRLSDLISSAPPSTLFSVATIHPCLDATCPVAPRADLESLRAVILLI